MILMKHLFFILNPLVSSFLSSRKKKGRKEKQSAVLWELKYVEEHMQR